MRHQQQRKFDWIKNFLKSQLLLMVGLLVVLFLLVVPLVNNLNKRSQLDKEIQQLKTEVTRNETQSSEFKKMIEYLDSSQFVEEQARLNLNLKKPGENVVSILDLDSTQTVQSAQSDKQRANEPEPPFSIKVQINHWLDYFFGKNS